MAVTRRDRLWFTGDEKADRLLAKDPLALLIGFELDQQVQLQKAFGPAGTPAAHRQLNAQDRGNGSEKLDAAFRERPHCIGSPATWRSGRRSCASVARDY